MAEYGQGPHRRRGVAIAGSIPDQVRAGCAWVAGRARSVRIQEAAIETYARTLPAAVPPGELDATTHFLEGDRESRAAFVICLDAINFGSGWWPTIHKRPGYSGYFTVAAGLTERFQATGAWSAQELTRLSATDVAEVVGQDPEHPLMADFAASLRDVGERVLADHGGRFTAVVDAADGSAIALADLLAGWQAFADISTYDGRSIPFYKRAQITAADLNRTGVAALRDEGRLTAFADNLVPHVLRVDGVLRIDSKLEQTIEAGELIAHDSPEEVELRACGVHAVELLADAIDRRLTPAQIDAALWNRGQQPRYKAIPRPRCRSTAY
ncbi:MAG: queuosine salvage family protein [Solirubrobacterales bacterium]